MNATCLVNCHNYREHVGEAVRSALGQSVAFERVVVVDDGSTDGSVELLRGEFGGEARVEIVEKPQAGQLSCFNRGMESVDTDLVFFLDADDRYHPQYLAAALGVYRQRPEVDFLSVAPRAFGAGAAASKRRPNRTRDLGVSVLGAALGAHWLGERTSCLSMRSATARRVLPYPHEAEWITRADDVLVFGASIVGAFKHHLEQPLVDYRVHGQNHFAAKGFDDLTKLRRSLAVSRLVGWYASREGYAMELLPACLHREFRTREKPTLRELRGYLGLSLGSRLPLSTRCQHAAAMCWRFAQQKFAGGRSVLESPANNEVGPTPSGDAKQRAA